MNVVTLMGRITKDIEVKYTSGAEPVAVTNLTLAIDRQKKGETDFIPVTVWGRQAENCEKYLSKGSRVAVSGRIQVDKSEYDGQTKYFTKVVAQSVEFIDYKKTEESHEDSFQMIREDVPF